MRFKWLGAVMVAGGLALSACGGGGDGGGGGGAVADGKEVFMGTCKSCHGEDAKGIEGSGKNLVDSTFVAGQTEEQLAAFITAGRTADDPANTTGIAMPPKGGNAALSEEDIANAAAYVKSINQAG